MPACWTMIVVYDWKNQAVSGTTSNVASQKYHKKVL